MEPYYDDGACVIYHGDSRNLLADLRGDVVVTDPPYGLAFMGKAWDTVNQQFHQTWAAAAFQALPPGGWLLAFGGTRTWHRLACGIEDAGFEIRDTLMWLYGKGFPKSQACLKPGWEPILLARKPGASVLQIDASRLEYVSSVDQMQAKPGGRATSKVGALAGGSQNDRTRNDFQADNSKGRWPPNLALDESAADLLDQHQSGVSRFFYTSKAGRSERVKVDGKGHPTVKPLALMRWLVRLVTPPGGTVVDPFCGSGSTLVAAAMEGFQAIGVEADERWCRGSAQRVAQVPPVQEKLAL